METLEKIKELTEVLSVDATKFYKGNKSAGTRARKTAQELKALLQKFRGEILDHKKMKKMHNIDSIFFFLLIFSFLVVLKNLKNFISTVTRNTETNQS